MAKDLGIACELNLHLGATSTMCLVNRIELGKAKHVDMQNLWDTRIFQVKTVRHGDGGCEREPRRLDDENNIGTKDRAAHETRGL